LPVSGEVLASNDAVVDSPEMLNSDPFGAAWLVRIRLSDPSELDALMDATAYAAYLESREH
jgi:glycine cleavage system H protein